MFFDIFGEIRSNLEKPAKLKRPNLLTINPSSQVCYSPSGVQLGSCLRSVWLDKTNQPKTNSISLKARMAAFSGNWWEDWFIDQLKQIHVYEDSQFVASDPSRLMKGLVDVSFTNPKTNKLELIEVKTYDGSNYIGSQAVLGTKSKAPKPRMSHLLQSFRYLLIYKDDVDAINLCYIDRACGDWYKYKQFRVSLVEVGDNLCPKIETNWNNGYYSYTEVDVSEAGIDQAELSLLDHLGENRIPMKEFKEEYSSTEINERYLDGDIAKYLYDRWIKDPENNSIGDYQCKFCAFSNGTCKSYD